MTAVFDTHCHLTAPELRPSLPQILERCQQASVGGLSLISADFPSLNATAELQLEIQKLAPTLKVVRSAGIHPHDAKAFWSAGVFDEESWQRVRESARTAAAIGETGLDFHYHHSDVEQQKAIFHRHIDLACESGKPLVIHCRESATAILECLDREDLRRHPNPGILHCFAEDESFARKVLDVGFYISFSGIVTFKNAEALRSVVPSLPLDRILVETDSPWLAPLPYRGKINEPSYVREVLKQIQSLRPENPDQVAAQIWSNSCRVFSC